jgi:hypothetical protein
MRDLPIGVAHGFVLFGRDWGILAGIGAYFLSIDCSGSRCLDMVNAVVSWVRGNSCPFGIPF